MEQFFYLFFDNRIEINSMGGLIESLSKDGIFNGVSDSRNPNLADLFHRLGYVESYGTGIRRIVQEYEGDLHEPTVEITNNVFKFVLPNRNYSQDVEGAINSAEEHERWQSSAERALLEYLRDNKEIKRSEAEDVLGLAKSATKNALGKMVDDGLLLKMGSGKNTVYILANDNK